MASYDTAQICLNGHVISIIAGSSPEIQDEFCSKCGEKTIMECSQCKTFIHGQYYPVSLWSNRYDLPAYCHKCGAMYPWTSRTIESAREYIKSSDSMSDDDKQVACDLLIELIKDTPDIELASEKFKTAISELSKTKSDKLKSILEKMLTYNVQRKIWS